MDLCDTHPDSPSLFYALNALWSYHAMRCDLQAIDLVTRQLKVAAGLNSEMVAVLASNARPPRTFSR